MRADQGMSGIFRPRESGVTEHTLEDIDMDELAREDGGSADVPETIYQATFPADKIMDLFKEELKDKKITAGGVIPFLFVCRPLTNVLPLRYGVLQGYR